MATLLRVSLGQHSLAGRHPVNQDFHGAVLPEGRPLQLKGLAVALADGIGSSEVSQVASAAAVRGFLEDYYNTSEAWPVRRAAQRVLMAMNSWLHAQTQRSDARFHPDRGYVCTFSALVLKGRELHLLHVGDSRIYRVHPHALEQLTEDHRVRLSSAESYLGRALGAAASVEIDYGSWTAEVGEVYLLATDGAYEFLDAAAVRDALQQHVDDLGAAAQALAQRAYDNGSDDNITLQLLRIDALPELEAAQLPVQRLGLKLPPVLTERQAFEGYTIVRELHASARSHVYLANEDASGRRCVIKTPAVEMQEQPEHLDRFLLEEWVARRLDSPHVLQAVDNERPREHLFVAMEAVEGGTLAQWMIDHPRPELSEVRALVEQIAKGLQAFHRKEMLHQDLRPENIMIDRGGTAKIIDFGSVHVAGLTEGSSEARATAMVGSLQYTAPEYFLGDGGTAASDLFSLAVLTYQMLCGQLPYGLQVTRLRNPRDVQSLRCVPIRSLRPDLPAWLDAVLRKALHPQPHKRQAVLTEFIADLHSPGSEFQGQRMPALIERDPLRFWQGLSVLLGLAVLVLAGLLLSRPGA